MTLQDDNPAACQKTFMEHLEDLRTTILWSAGFLFIGLLIAIPIAPLVLRLIKLPVARAGVDADSFLRVLGVTSGFSIAMKIVFWCGLLIAMPGILYAVGRFVLPGLTRRERRAVGVILSLASVLFAGGVCMGYFLTLPIALNWLLTFNAWMGVRCDFVELGDYVSFAMKVLAACGLGCELPVVVLALGYLGIVSSATLRRYRRHVVVVVLIIAAILTPPDVMSQLMLAVPMQVLYEACIWIVWFKERTRAKALAAESETP